MNVIMHCDSSICIPDQKNSLQCPRCRSFACPGCALFDQEETLRCNWCEAELEYRKPRCYKVTVRRNPDFFYDFVYADNPVQAKVRSRSYLGTVPLIDMDCVLVSTS
jgi:hypothetical protein